MRIAFGSWLQKGGLSRGKALLKLVWSARFCCFGVGSAICNTDMGNERQILDISFANG